MLGITLGTRYSIIRHLGGGGFAQTYLAEDKQLPGNHLCVVKQLKPQATDPETLQIARRLFDTEAQVLYKLGNHDRIPQLFAYFEENQEFYLVQEFIEGHDLSQEITPPQTPPYQGGAGVASPPYQGGAGVGSPPYQGGAGGGSPGNSGGMKEDEVIGILQELLEILDFVHQQNVIHRDVNPRNILRRDRDGKLVLIDFGAVKEITTQITNSQPKNSLSVSIGTPGYMPSEQAHGNPKLSSDIYAAGAIAIQFLTGINPHQMPKNPDTEEIIWQDKVSVSPEFAKILDRMVKYDFRQRYSSAGETLQAIKELQNSFSGTVPILPPVVAAKKLPKPRQKLYFKIGAIAGFIGITIIASIYGVNTFNSANATDLHNRGITLYNLSRFEEALAAYDRAITLRPDYAEVWQEKAKTLYELKKYKESQSAYDKAIELKPEYLEAWTGRGYALDKLEQSKEAIASFDNALKIQPDYPAAWEGRGDALLDSQRYEEAIASYEKAVHFQPNLYLAWYNRGQAHQNLKQYDRAVESYQKAVEIKFDNSDAWYNLGNVFLELNKNQEAFEAYEKAVRFQPNFYQAWYSKGIALLKMRRHEEAVEAYEKAVKLKPDYHQAWYNLGWSYHELRKYESAIECYSKALDLNPKESQGWYNRGNAQYNLKRYEDAIASYNEAVYVKPDYSEAWYSRGNALVAVKRFGDAIGSYDKAIRYKPDYGAAVEAKKRAESQLGNNPQQLQRQ
ncbi:MAG: tetratricopeptide repeat protein [Microcoleus sp. PH2017_29_MFU_D_A]|uniref:tetratricopeptide repeat protein n=1 Tax=unclassified Microcoleus TaxID=2642155 RepID=UPI001DF7C897|nr:MULTISPECIES: tetratricopeptide repeat protein [unclassified Microcoleus]MCC3602023.1 tetratricopeptide repeat protein [Microcoleus sp. PH2017_29_MFU_D_A]MCC3633303.1 tetratricopeptide repeat protein [Microcoleus sp. PH2017_37_MFU_D_B]